MIEDDIIPSRTDVMSMAREAGLEDEVLVPWAYEINMFAALIASRVAAKERETCAELMFDIGSAKLANAIRARSDT